MCSKMNERQYMEKRYILMKRMEVARQFRCFKTAEARKRDLEKLDREYNEKR